MKTIRFYTDNELYKGWQSIKNTTFSEVRSWILSGNYIKIGNKTFNFSNYTNLLVSKTFNK